MTALLIAEMIRYYSGDPKRIQHFIKVHDFSRTIGMLEGLDEKTLFILETAAIVHDIGIKKCEKKYGSCEGKLQEQEGPAVAKKLLERLGYHTEIIERVCYLVGHHHTYTDIEGIDYQILVEADFLVNACEDNLPRATIKGICERIFRTESGNKLCTEMFKLKKI